MVERRCLQTLVQGTVWKPSGSTPLSKQWGNVGLKILIIQTNSSLVKYVHLVLSMHLVFLPLESDLNSSLTKWPLIYPNQKLPVLAQCKVDMMYIGKLRTTDPSIEHLSHQRTLRHQHNRQP